VFEGLFRCGFLIEPLVLQALLVKHLCCQRQNFVDDSVYTLVVSVGVVLYCLR